MHPDDFESLPPAVRRKFFSNAERLRLRLAQSDPCSTPNHPVNAASYSFGSGSGARPIRRRAPSTCSKGSYSPSNSLKRHHKHQSRQHWQSTRRLRKPTSLQLAALIAQADSQCYHSLPAKIQQKLFSPEERRRFCLVRDRNSLIRDSADEAFSRRQPSKSREFGPGSASASASRGTTRSDRSSTAPISTIFYDSSSEESDWEDSPNMDQSVYDSFRWLDEDGDLDLSLDEYHSHVADAATRKQRYSRLPSFRRSLSFSTHAKHRPSPSMPIQSTRSILPLSPLPPLSPLSPLSPRSTRRSTSRPASRRLQSSHGYNHAAKSSTSSIDPSAQYYQDPDARLKLRVYLASPQKFDEAIEFGFPALDQFKENIDPEQKQKDGHEDHDQDENQIQDREAGQESISISTKPAKSFTGTFFEDDDGTVVGSPGESIESPDPLDSYTPPPPATQGKPQIPAKQNPSHNQDRPTILQRRQSLLPQSKTKTPLRISGTREMTLKMTLTRPDLREDSTTTTTTSSSTGTGVGGTAMGSGSGSGSGVKGTSSMDDPLRLAELPPADRTQFIWDDLDGEGGVVRKMWRKLRRR